MKISAIYCKFIADSAGILIAKLYASHTLHPIENNALIMAALLANTHPESSDYIDTIMLEKGIVVNKMWGNLKTAVRIRNADHNRDAECVVNEIMERMRNENKREGPGR